MQNGIKEKKINSKNISITYSIQIIVSIGMSTTGGFIIGGIQGAFTGLLTVIFDEYLIHNEQSSKHYFTTSAYYLSAYTYPASKTLVKYFPQYEMPIYAAMTSVAAFMAYNVEDFLSFQDKLEVPVQSFLSINNLFDEKNILSEQEFSRIYQKIFENRFEGLSIIYQDAKELYNNNKFFSNFMTSNLLELTKVICNTVFLNLLGSFSQGVFIDTFLKGLPKGDFNRDTAIKGIKIISIILIETVACFIIDMKLQKLENDQFDLVIEKSTELTIKHGREILATEKGKQIVDNLISDLYNLVFSGASNLIKVSSENLKSLFSLNNLVKFAPDSLFTYSLGIIPLQTYLKYKAKESKELAEKLSELWTKKRDIISDIKNNIEQISLRDGQEFSKNKYNALQADITALKIKDDYNRLEKNSVNNVIKVVNCIIDLGYFGLKSTGENPIINIGKIPLIVDSIGKINNFLSSNLNLQIQNKELIISKDRLEKFIAIISESQKAELVRSINLDNKIIFKDYHLKLPNKYVDIPYLEFEQGKHYAITGEVGCGKTSTLIDMKMGVSGALKSSGEISLPANAKIMYIDQKLYLPKDATLLESIYFPNSLNHLSNNEVIALKDQIINLMNEIEIDNSSFEQDMGLKSNLDSNKFKLSGGQTKKTGIIQAKIFNPTILIIDEIFSELDSKSVMNVQIMLKKYLPNTTILCIDHYAHSNNYNNFYDYEVNFADNTVIIKSIEANVTEIKEDLLLGNNSTTTFIEVSG